MAGNITDFVLNIYIYIFLNVLDCDDFKMYAS